MSSTFTFSTSRKASDLRELPCRYRRRGFLQRAFLLLLGAFSCYTMSACLPILTAVEGPPAGCVASTDFIRNKRENPHSKVSLL